jgi:hypothetical protein
VKIRHGPAAVTGDENRISHFPFKDGKARQVEGAGSQKTCLQTEDRSGLCAVQAKLKSPGMKNGIHGPIKWFVDFLLSYGTKIIASETRGYR